MICGLVGFDFEGIIRLSYAEVAGNSVTFPSFANSSSLLVIKHLAQIKNTLISNYILNRTITIPAKI